MPLDQVESNKIEEFELAISLYDQLINLDNSNIEKCFNFIINDYKYIRTALVYINNMSRIYFKKIETYVELTQMIYKHTNEKPIINIFINNFFFIRLFLRGIYTDEDLILIKDEYLIFLLSPYLSEESPLLDGFKVKQEYSHLSKEEIIQIGLNGFTDNSLECHIKNDDVRYICKYEIDFNEQVGNKYSVLKTACLYGSINIFRYYMNTKIDLKDVERFVIEGGSTEIIELCSQNGVNFGSSIYKAIELLKNNIVGWIYDNYGDFDFCKEVYTNANYEVMSYYFNFDKIMDFLTKSRESDHSVLGIIHIAAKKGYMELVLFLLNNGIDPNTKTFSSNAKKNGYTPLHFACKYGHVDVVDLLLERGANVNVETNLKHNTPLIFACEFQHVSIVEKLLKYGAYTNHSKNVTKKNYTPLQFACYNKNYKMLEILLKYNADPNYYTSFSQFHPAHIASSRCNTDILQLLLDNGCKFNVPQGSDNLSCLHLATSSNNFETVSYLSSLGFDINGKTATGETPLFYARTEEMVSLLISLGADINIRNINNRSAAVSAFYKNQPNVTKCLLLSGINIEISDERLLFKSIKRGFSDLVKYLIYERGVNVNCINRNGYTPICFVPDSNPELVDILTMSGAELDIMLSDGNYPANIAFLRYNPIIAEIIQEKGGFLKLPDLDTDLFFV